MPAVDRPGTPGGPYLAAKLRERARREGVDLTVDVQAYLARGSFAVRVGWGPRDDDELVCEVAETADAVHLHDFGGAEVRIDEAVDYVLLRTQGTPPADALAVARPPRRSIWSRLRHRATSTSGE